MGEKMNTQQARKFAAALDAESTRPELAAWNTAFTAAAMSIRQLADYVDFHLTQPAQAVDVGHETSLSFRVGAKWADDNRLPISGEPRKPARIARVQAPD